MRNLSEFKINYFSGILLSSIGFSIYIYLIFNPIITPDGIDILTISENLYSRGCLSYLKDCTPTTTDHGPIYPLIIWLVKIFKQSPINIILFLQNIFHIITCSAITLYLRKRYKLKDKSLLIVFGLNLLNPLAIGWQRYFLPDSLSLDIALIILLLIDSYLSEGKMKYIYFASLLVSVVSLLRYDSFFLIIPLIICFIFKQYGDVDLSIKKNFLLLLKKLIIIFVCSSFLLSFWSIRNISLGLTPVRETFFANKDSYIKPEIIDWIKSWTINTYDLPKGIYPYLSERANEIRPPEWALNKDLEMAIKNDKFLKEEETAYLASKQAKVIRSNILFDNFNNIKRLIWIVLGPLYSGGLPTDIPNNYFSINVIKPILIKLTNFFTRLIILVLAIRIKIKYKSKNFILINSGLLFIFIDSMICIYLGQIEQRYLNDSFLFLQYALLIELLNLDMLKLNKYRKRILPLQSKN